MLPNAMDANMFAYSKFLESDEASKSIDVDHTVCDSKFRFCTECVVELKDGADAHAILGEIQNAVDDGL
jgi:dihydroxyacetone kinase-like predicted kinase